MEFRILGPLEAWRGDAQVRLGAAKQRALLAVLLLNADRVVSIDRLVEELWGEEPPETAVKTVQVYVSQLRKALEPERSPGSDGSVVLTRSPGYLVRVGDDGLDLRRFERLAAEGRRARQAGDAEAAASLLREALDVWRGAPLADLAYEPFAQGEIARLEEMRLAALEDRIEADLEAGRAAELVGELESLTARHPLRERLHGQLMLALYRSGRQAEALEAYGRTRRALVENLGIEPGRALKDLQRAILAQDDVLDLVALARGSRAERPRRSDLLPEQLSSFVGREAELAALQRLLQRMRLVTVHGPGGAGKTRLAVRAARESAAAFADGAWLVDLAPVSGPGPVWPALAAALELREEPGRSLAETVTAELSRREALLVLDNCEHLIEPARDVADALLAGCPGVRIIATSRQPLSHAAEAVMALGELSLPSESDDLSVEAILAADAVRLFCDRAASAMPGWTCDEDSAAAVGAVCRRLDGMPLAIELAAARVKVLSPHDIERRLADRFHLLTRGRPSAPARHQTLEAAIDWSYELLSPAEQSVLARASVFSGGFDVEAAERVCDGDGVSADEVLEHMTELVDKSLVGSRQEAGWTRFALHESVREYAAVRLAEREDPERLRARHLDWFAELMVSTPEELRTPERSAWLRRMTLDQENFRHALGRGLEAGDPEKTLQLAWSLHHFWVMRGNLEEDERWLGQALARTADAAPSVQRTRALNRWAELAKYQGDYSAARERYLKSLAMGSALGDPVRQAVSLLGLSEVDLMQQRLAEARERVEEAQALLADAGDTERARWALDHLGRVELADGAWQRAAELFETSRRQARSLGNEGGVAKATHLLGLAAHQGGDFARARELYEEALGLARREDERQQEAASLVALGELALDTEAYDEATPRLTAALRFAHETDARPLVPRCLEGLAAVRAASAGSDGGARLLGAASAFREILGIPAHGLERSRRERTTAAVRDALDPERFAIAHGRGRALSWSDAVEEGLAVEGGPAVEEAR